MPMKLMNVRGVESAETKIKCKHGNNDAKSSRIFLLFQLNPVASNSEALFEAIQNLKVLISGISIETVIFVYSNDETLDLVKIDAGTSVNVGGMTTLEVVNSVEVMKNP